MKKKLILIATLVTSLFATSVLAQNLPDGFKLEKVCDLQSPSCMVFAPDGRIFIGEQDGRVLIHQNGKLLAEPAFKIGDVRSKAEKGLLGIAIDPDFATNKYIYTFSTKNNSGFNYDLIVERFTIENNKGVNSKVILDLGTVESRWYEIWNHNGGGMRFGNDGKLYIAVGYNDQDSRIQNLDSYMSKVVRINKDGSAPRDNPYYNEDGTAAKNRIYAYGMRNPFTLHFLKNTSNTMMITDVSSTPPSGREEITLLTEGGKNLGFPDYNGTSNNPDVADPIFQYRTTDQNSSTVETINGCAITGAVHYMPKTTDYPDKFKDKIFFMDFCNGWLSYLDISGTEAKRFPFATNLGKYGKGAGFLSLEEGVDGNLYFLTRQTRTPEQEGPLKGEIDPKAKGTLTRIKFDGGVAVEDGKKVLLNCTVQPNPAREKFSISLNSNTDGKCSVAIYDILGVNKLNMDYSVSVGENENEIDVSTLTKGTYIVNIKNEGKVAHKKLVIE